MTPPCLLRKVACAEEPKPSLNRWPRLLLAAGASLSLLAAASCLGDLSSPRSPHATLALAPAFPASATGIAAVDRLHIELQRTIDSSTVIDTTIQIQPSDSVVDLSFEVTMTSEDETFWLTVRCYTAADELTFQGGPLEVAPTPTPDTAPAPVDVQLRYVGVGSDAAGVEIVPSETAVFYGDTITLDANALDSAGSAIAGTPIAWTSLTSEVASVPDPSVGRLIAGTLRGTAQVEARLLTGQADTARVEVIPIVVRVELSPTFGTLGLMHDTLRFRAMAFDVTDSVVADARFLWLSSNHNVALVSDSGLVTATGSGAATITAAAQGIPGHATLTVTIQVGAVTVTPETADLLVGDTLRLGAIVADARGSVLDDRTVIWSTSDPNVATVNVNGLVTATGVGTATVAASTEGVSGAATIRVSATQGSAEQ